ncbi:PAS domain S-box protein [Candidatus Falkowbacteria bacterium]|nr:PAS domain S-box protein [Candidatus Falkowbacteria bacterium]
MKPVKNATNKKNERQNAAAFLQKEILGHKTCGCENCDTCGLLPILLDMIGALVVILDKDGRIIYFNRVCEETTGYKFKEVAGKFVWEFLLVPEEIESVKAVFDQLEKKHLPIKHENYWVAKNKAKRLISWSNADLVCKGKAVEYVIGTGIDITGHRNAEEKIKEHAAELERLNHVMIGRELKMIELKKEIEELKSK